MDLDCDLALNDVAGALDRARIERERDGTGDETRSLEGSNSDTLTASWSSNANTLLVSRSSRVIGSLASRPCSTGEDGRLDSGDARRGEDRGEESGEDSEPVEVFSERADRARAATGEENGEDGGRSSSGGEGRSMGDGERPRGDNGRRRGVHGRDNTETARCGEEGWLRGDDARSEGEAERSAGVEGRLSVRGTSGDEGAGEHAGSYTEPKYTIQSTLYQHVVGDVPRARYLPE